VTDLSRNVQPTFNYGAPVITILDLPRRGGCLYLSPRLAPHPAILCCWRLTVRPLIVAAVTLLTVSATAPPVVAAMPFATSSTTVVSQTLPDHAVTTVQMKSKKKKKKDKDKDKDKAESGTINTIDTFKQGKIGAKATAEVSASDRFCELTITWKDGTAGPIVRANADGASTCAFSVDVPNESRVVGKGIADLKVLKIKDGKEIKVATDSRTFTVK
jgi:hypothetical protein